MKLFKYIFLSLLLLVGQVSYSQNNLISNGANLIKVGNSLLTWSYDVDAQVFFDSLEANGTTLTFNQKASVSTLVRGMKGKSIWDNTDIIYPIIGGTASAHSFNLRNPATNQIIWVNGPTHSATGVDYNGTTQYGRTGIIPSITLSGTAHGGVYQRETAASNGYAFGATKPSDFIFQMIPRNSSDISFVAINGQGTNVALSVTDDRGLMMMDKDLVPDHYIVYRNGLEIGETTPAPRNRSPDIEIYLGCRNNNGSPQSFISKQAAFYTFGETLSVTQHLDYYNIIQQFQISNNREVN